MHIAAILEDKNPCLSFEFFPLKSEAASASLYTNLEQLQALKPGYVSVTYGAGGSTRDLTHDLLVKLKKETSLEIVSHLTLVSHSKKEIKDILNRYSENGIDNIMALRGDPPGGGSIFNPHPDGFRYAGELVEFIKNTKPEMGVGVAGFPEGHPETPNRLHEIRNLKAKVDAGADYICTQFFFDNNDFYDFVERCQLVGIKVPIVAGIMPVTSLKGMERMAQLALGSGFLQDLCDSLKEPKETTTSKTWASIGLLSKYKICSKTEYVASIFIPLNKSEATREIYRSIGISTSETLLKN